MYVWVECSKSLEEIPVYFLSLPITVETYRYVHMGNWIQWTVLWSPVNVLTRLVTVDIHMHIYVHISGCLSWIRLDKMSYISIWGDEFSLSVSCIISPFLVIITLILVARYVLLSRSKMFSLIKNAIWVFPLTYVVIKWKSSCN